MAEIKADYLRVLLILQAPKGVVLVRSAKDSTGKTEGPPQGPVADESISALYHATKRLALNECDADLEFKGLLFVCNGIERADRVTKRYLVVHAVTHQSTFRPRDGSVISVRTVASHSALDEAMRAASPQKLVITKRGITAARLFQQAPYRQSPPYLVRSDTSAVRAEI